MPFQQNVILTRATGCKKTAINGQKKEETSNEILEKIWPVDFSTETFTKVIACLFEDYVPDKITYRGTKWWNLKENASFEQCLVVVEIIQDYRVAKWNYFLDKLKVWLIRQGKCLVQRLSLCALISG